MVALLSCFNTFVGWSCSELLQTPEDFPLLKSCSVMKRFDKSFSAVVVVVVVEIAEVIKVGVVGVVWEPAPLVLNTQLSIPDMEI